jgi:hypothetical protein
MTWNEEYEGIAKNVGERAEGLSWMHYRSFSTFSSVGFVITFMNIVITIFICAFSFSKLSCEVSFFHWLLGSLGATATLLLVLNKFLEPSERSQKHFHAFTGYSSLYRKVASELILQPMHRSEVHQFIAFIEKEYEHLANYSPNIPDSIVTKFKHKFQYKTVKPEIANGYTEIQVA